VCLCKTYLHAMSLAPAGTPERASAPPEYMVLRISSSGISSAGELGTDEVG